MKYRVLVGAVVVLSCFLHAYYLPLPGHIFDTSAFSRWIVTLATAPVSQGYIVVGDFGYPPTAMWLFQGMAHFYAAFIHDDANRTSLKLLIKTVAFVFDAAGAVITYEIAFLLYTPRKAIAALACYALNPALIYDSAVWGQLDSPALALLLGAFYCVVSGKRVTAWVVLTLAILYKPMGIVFVPLLLIESGVEFWPDTALGVMASVMTVFGMEYTFAPDKFPLHVMAYAHTQLLAQMQIYPYTTMNAFNVWALPTDFFVNDSGWKTVGIVVFFCVAALIFIRYLLNKTSQRLLESAFLLSLGFFLVLTEMHERYLIYAVAFAPVIAVANVRYFKAALTVTITQWLNMEYAMSFAMLTWPTTVTVVNTKEFAPVLVRLCSVANIVAFFSVLLYGAKRTWRTYF